MTRWPALSFHMSFVKHQLASQVPSLEQAAQRSHKAFQNVSIGALARFITRQLQNIGASQTGIDRETGPSQRATDIYDSLARIEFSHVIC